MIVKTIGEQYPVELNVYNKGANSVIVVVHGASEGKSRYTEFAQRFASSTAVITYNHPGHETGEDVIFSTDEILLTTKQVIDYAIANYEQVTIFSHSMGTLVIRNILDVIPTNVNLILSGAPVIKLGDRISSYLGLIPLVFMKKNKSSKQLNYLVFDQKSSKIGLVDKQWLSTDEQQVLAYLNSPLTNKLFTNQSLVSLIQLTLAANTAEVNRKLEQYRVLLVSGMCDCFTNNGLNYQVISRRAPSAQIKIYPNSFHEVHNDIDKLQLDKDIRKFIEKETDGKN